MRKSVLSLLLAVSLLGGCATDPYTGQSKVSKTAWGTGIGTAVGAGVGALVGGEKGAMIGAGIGAVSGAAAGGYMDLQARKLRQELVGTGVQVAVLENGQIQLVMPSNITFDFDSAVFKTGFNHTLDSVAKVLKEYNKTNVIVAGYTDNVGKADYNNQLSLKRAQAVADYLILRNVSPARISVYGYGSQYPVASNATEAGRAQNRRVTITLQQIQ